VNIQGRTRFGIIATAMALALVLQPGIARDHGDRDDRRSLVGAWKVTIKPVVCATGAEIPNVAFPALFTFHEDGTLSVWAQNRKITTTRGENHGVWKFNPRWKNYSAKFVHQRYDLATGDYLGEQWARMLAVLDRDGNSFTSEATTIGLDPAGNEAYNGCSKSVGTRITLED
jgi:hypothetical protein